MKKVFLVLVTLVTLSFAEPADRTGPYIAVGGGYALFEDDRRMETASQEVNPSYNLNIIGGAFINRYLSVELSYDYYDTFVNDLNENTTKLSIIDVATKAHYPLWKERIDLYGAFGAGQVFWSENLNGVRQDSKSGILRGDVGIGYRPLNWLTFNVGFRRYFFTLDQQTGTDSDGNVLYHRYYMELSSGYANIEVQF